MAGKKVLIYQCDHCGSEHKRSTRGKQAAPKGWVEVMGRDICDGCLPDLELWLDGQLPKRDDTVTLHFHKGVDPDAPSVQRIVHAWGNPENSDSTTVVS